MGDGLEGHSGVMWWLVMVGLVLAKCGLGLMFQFCVLNVFRRV